MSPTSSWAAVLVPWDCQNKVSQTGGLETTGMYPHSQESAVQVLAEPHSPCGSRGGAFLPLPASSGPRGSQVWGWDFSISSGGRGPAPGGSDRGSPLCCLPGLGACEMPGSGCPDLLGGDSTSQVPGPRVLFHHAEARGTKPDGLSPGIFPVALPEVSFPINPSHLHPWLNLLLLGTPQDGGRGLWP